MRAWAGLVDLVGLLVPLPEGTEKAFLAFAFGVEGFVITLHKKSEAFDAMVHGLLAATMWAAALFVGLEIRYPKSLLVSAGRSLSVLLQGMWLVQVRTLSSAPLPSHMRILVFVRPFPSRLPLSLFVLLM